MWCLLWNAQRHKAWVTCAAHQEQQGFAPRVLYLFQSRLEIGDGCDLLLACLGDDVTGTQALFKGLGRFVHIRHRQSVLVLRRTQLLAQLVRQAAQREAKNLFRYRRFGLFRGSGHGGHSAFSLFAAAQRNPQGHCFSAAINHDADRFTNRAVAHLTDQAACVFNLDARKADDDIAIFHACIHRGALRHRSNQRACDGLKADGLGDVVGHVLDAHAQPTAAGFAEFLQLVDHAGHHVRGHGKADANGAAIGRQDRRVHTDHFAIHVKERTARVAPVDGRVGLDVVVIGAAQRPIARRHDPCGHRKPLTERVAHGHDPIAHTGHIAIAKGHKLQRLIRLDLQQGDVGVRVSADHGRLELLSGLPFAGVELDQDLIGPFDDVVVGHDIAVLRNHKAGAKRRRPARTLPLAVVVAVLKVAKEVFEWRSFGHDALGAGTPRHHCRGGDVDHRGADLLGQWRKAFGPGHRRKGLHQHKGQRQRTNPEGTDISRIGKLSRKGNCLSLHQVSPASS
mmetsp:Transcript_23952/g.43696  ORF Transcript_23952/g.43696 Transcript_23952/m.43696 type:complete len:509 (-) Transcript_23952:2323-3849(-)